MSRRLLSSQVAAGIRLLRSGLVLLGFGVVQTLSAQTFNNPATITIPSQGVAGPYPSVIAVSGVSGTVSKLTVTLLGLNHTFPDDVDVLLVGPDGCEDDPDVGRGR